MHKGTETILWVVVLAVLGVPLAYAIWCAPGQDFWESVASGLLATSAALIGGIPIALSIDRAVKKQEQARQNKETRKKERELLVLLKEEIELCQSMLETRKENPERLYTQPFKSDLWHAVSAAGKLNLIQEPGLLNDLSAVYYLIDMVRKIEEQGYNAARSATVSFSGGGTATENLWRDARSFDELLTQGLEGALSSIDEDLANE